MLKSKSQISIEYLILVGFIMGIILIPAVYFLKSFAGEGVYNTLNNKRANDLGHGIINNAEQLFYLGLYSKHVVEYEVPKNVQNMFIVEIDDGTDIYYYFTIFTQDNKYYFQSEVPLMSDDSSSLLDTTDDDSLISECSGNCDFSNFIGTSIQEGRKKFLLETKLDPISSKVKVSISPVE